MFDLFQSDCLKLSPKILQSYLKNFVNKFDNFLKIAEKNQSPFYVFDSELTRRNIIRLINTFDDFFDDNRLYYALKSNNCELLIKTVISCGLGLDVSSGKELDLSLQSGCEDIVFSGPGKTDEELTLAVQNANRVTVLLDSFEELNRLEKIAQDQCQTIKAGVRLTTRENSLWRKFGVTCSMLPLFFKKAETCRFVDLKGLQFHTSWNLTPQAQTDFITILGRTIKTLEPYWLESLEFLDIGGGFWPEQGEWLQQSDGLRHKFSSFLGRSDFHPLKHYYKPAEKIESFAEKIKIALDEHIFPLKKLTICAEPGRWISNDSMHILMQVMDKKFSDLVVTNAGINQIGWERFETDYAPVINLSRFSYQEKSCLVCGSLCTPHDLWGYSYFGSDIEVGDWLLVPDQGAYTYSLRQEFIKPLAPVISLK